MTRNASTSRKQEQPNAQRKSSAANSAPPAATGLTLLDLQSEAGNQTMSEWLQSGLSNEHGGKLIQTKSNNGGAENQAGPAAETTTQEQKPTTKSLLVDDDAKQIQAGQMRKGEFLSSLRASVSGAAEQALAGTIWSSMGCPYIDKWFAHFDQQPAARLERSLLKYAPDAAGVKNAREYIPIVTQRVRSGIAEWTETGQMTGLPEEFAGGEMPGATVSGLVSGALSGIGSAVSEGLSSVGSMFFKAREQKGREVEDPAAIQTQLGEGQSLDSRVQERMEGAFGMSFSGVRVHADGKAQELSAGLDARAFTVGNDIAFGAGEYQPNSLIGDALIAHELAHVAQQGGGSSPAPLGKGGAEYNSLEEDADVAAVGAVMSAWVGTKGLVTDIGKHAMPRVRSGLRLQRCSKQEGKEDPKRFEEIKKILEKVPTGKEGLKVMDDYKVKVRFIKGSYKYDPSSNTVYLDSEHDIARSALDFSHEIHHAKAQNTGATPDIKKLSRSEYIKKMLEEEAEGTVKSIETKIELEGTDVEVSAAVFPMEAEYKAAHKAAVDAEKAKDPTKSEADLKKIGREAGYKRVLKGFQDGDVPTSTSGETYPNYYGRLWDEEHN
jgi:hypothetical protein